VENAIVGVIGECECLDGFFMDPVFKICKTCGGTCATCESADKCKTCPDEFSLGDTKCLQCSAGEFIDGDSCLKCGDNCLKCGSLAQCEICGPNSDLTNGECLCKDGFLMDSGSKTCLACGDTCATCDNIDICKTCPLGFGLGDTICLSCATDEYIDGD